MLGDVSAVAHVGLVDVHKQIRARLLLQKRETNAIALKNSHADSNRNGDIVVGQNAYEFASHANRFAISDVLVIPDALGFAIVDA